MLTFDRMDKPKGRRKNGRNVRRSRGRYVQEGEMRIWTGGNINGKAGDWTGKVISVANYAGSKERLWWEG